jgi:hypothetical protein
MQTRHLIALLPAVLAPGLTALHAQQPAAAETKLRETLRTTMLELRTAQTEKANLQATLAGVEATNRTMTAELDALKKKFDALTAQAADDQAAARKEIDGLTARLADRDADLVRHRESLEKWRIAHQQVTGIARKK